MSYLNVSDWQIKWRALAADMTMLQQQIGAVQALQKKDPAGYPFPSGDWWQTSQGFFGEFSQFYSEQVQPTPIIPWQSTEDLDKYRARYEQLRADFIGGQKVNKTQLGAGNVEAPPSAAGGLTTALWIVGGVMALGAVGYVLSGVARLEGH